jgi:hypothetical protein
LSRAEAERIAASGSALRPAWSQEQILGVLADPRIRVHRTPADTAAALARLALDPDTRQPTRLLEAGPWWTTNTSSGPTYRKPEPDDCHHCHRPAHADIPDDHDYLAAKSFRPRPTPMPESVRSLLVRPAARTPKPETPKRPVEDILADHITQEKS